MLFAFVYSLLRLLLDVADVRLRVRDPEAELLVGCKYPVTGQSAS